MAIISTSAVIEGFDHVVDTIFTARASLKNAKAVVTAEQARLGDIPNAYADLLETVNAMPAGGTMFQQECKAKLSALTAEFGPLRTQAVSAKTWLDTNVTEF